MYKINRHTIRRNIYLTPQIYEQSKIIDNKLGVKYNEYIRYLISQDISKYELNEIDFITQKEKIELRRIVIEIRNHRHVASKDIEKVLRRLID